MKLVAVLLIIVGLAGIGIGFVAFGDIGIAALIGGLSGLLSGIGIFLVARRFDRSTQSIAS